MFHECSYGEGARRIFPERNFHFESDRGKGVLGEEDMQQFSRTWPVMRPSGGQGGERDMVSMLTR